MSDIVLSEPGPVEVSPGAALASGINAGYSVSALVQKNPNGSYGGFAQVKQNGTNLYGKVAISPYAWGQGDTLRCCYSEGFFNFMGKAARLDFKFMENTARKALSQALWVVFDKATGEILSSGSATFSGFSVTVPLYSGVIGGG